MILNFNGLKWLKTCLPSVVASTYRDLVTYIVDNGSTDGSLHYVRTEFPGVRLIVFEENLGFSEAYNRSISQVEANYILLLNNDTSVLNSNWISSLATHLNQDSSVAAVGCKLVTMKDHAILDSVGVMGIRYWRGFVDIGKYERDRGQHDNPPINPFAVCGAAMLVRRSAFTLIGGFDSKFFSYTEDVDLCWRLRLLGFKLAYEPAAEVAHYYSGTRPLTDLDPQKLYFSHRNLLRAMIKNCGSSLSWALRNYFLYTIMLAVGFAVLEPPKAVAVIRAVLWNVLNLKDTYARRVNIQHTRIVEDDSILRAMFPEVTRYRPNDHSYLRHILDVIFEHDHPLRSRLRILES